jgi:hypothetical protein
LPFFLCELVILAWLLIIGDLVLIRYFLFDGAGDLKTPLLLDIGV